MTMPFTANLSILPAEQQRLWEKLSETPDEFVLYGGTALALRLGHRVSVDFDDLPLDKVPEPMRKDLVKSVEAVSLTQIKERTAHWDGLIKKRDQDRRPG